MPASRRNPILRTQAAFDADVDPRSLIAAWPMFARSLHTAATRLDKDTDLRYRRLAASSVVVTSWNKRSAVGSGTPDPGVLELAQQIATATPIRDRAKAIARLDDLTWVATGTLISRFHDHLGELRVADVPEMTEAIADWRRARAAIVAAHVQAEVDRDSRSTRAGLEPVVEFEAVATRTLNAAPTTMALWVVARQQERNTTALLAAVDQHHRLGGLDGLEAERVLTGLDESRAAWGQLRDSLEPLATQTRPLPPALSATGDVARVHLAGLGRGSERQLRHNLSASLAGGVSLAALATEVIDSGQLRGPAAAINRAAMVMDPREEGAHVDPVALHRRQTIPVVDVVRKDLEYQSLRLRDSLEWTGHIAKVQSGQWDQSRGRSGREVPRRDVPERTERKGREIER